MALDFIDVYQYHSPLKISPKNSTRHPNFEHYTKHGIHDITILLLNPNRVM
jgi:hypothetical protein